MNTIKRIISVIAVVMILISAGGADVSAAEAEDNRPDLVSMQAGSLLVESESTDYYRYENGTLYIYGGTVSLKTSPDVEYSAERIEVSGYACLYLDGLRIRARDGAAIRILPGAYAEIRLSGHDSEEESENETDDGGRFRENYLKGADGCAGIEAGTLSGGDGGHIMSASLRISGEGYLTAVGGEGAAAIGSGRGQDACGSIVLEEGNIRALAGSGADAVGCGAGCASDPLTAPVIREEVEEFIAFSDGTGSTIAHVDGAHGTGADERGEETIRGDGTAEPAAVLTAVFSESGGGSLTGPENISIRDTSGGSGKEFTMPDGYRAFSVKVDTDREYMIEQGGRIFGMFRPEESSEEMPGEGGAKLVFKGSLISGAQQLVLLPLEKAPAFDLDVKGCWEDEDDTDGIRPDSVRVTLYANGKETGRTLTLSEDNDWTGTFEELSVYEDSVRQSYSVVEEGIDGYMGMIGGSDSEGYTITNRHVPLPEGRSSEEEIAERSGRPFEEGRLVGTVLTTKITRTTPARTSTTIKKTASAKTADSSNLNLWGGILLAAVCILFVWMRNEEKKD